VNALRARVTGERDAVEVRAGQVRVDEDGDLYKVVEVDERWAWCR
jgi:hypothetical protein